MKFFCLYCRTNEDIQEKPNGKLRCPKCKAAMAPHSVIGWAADNRTITGFDDDMVYDTYCACPNARLCFKYNHYKPSCEDLVFTPACLHALYVGLERLGAYCLAKPPKLPGVNKTPPSPRPPEFPDKQTPGGLDT